MKVGFHTISDIIVKVLVLFKSAPKMKDLHKTVFPKIASEWKIVADFLDYDIPKINLIAETGKEDPMKCCTELFSDWLTTDNGLTPKTWSTLIETLKRIHQLSGYAEQIEESLKCEYNDCIS